jgi:hypothetical protein
LKDERINRLIEFIGLSELNGLKVLSERQLFTDPALFLCWTDYAATIDMECGMGNEEGK